MPAYDSWINFQYPTKLHFETDCSFKVGTYLKNTSSRILLLTTQKEMINQDELAIIKTSLEKHTKGVILYDDIEDYATTKEINSAIHFAKMSNTDCIISYGGFESMNTGKLVSALIHNDLFAEDITAGNHELKKSPLPHVVIPTTPLFGLENSPYAFVNDESGSSIFYEHPYLFPDAIIADPKIGFALGSNDIAKIGISIIASSVDSLLSKFANEFSTTPSLRAIELLAKSLVNSAKDPKNLQLKGILYSSSLLAGISLSNSSPGLCIALSLATSSHSDMDIYQAMVILLPHIMEYNLTSSAGKYVLIAKALDEDTSNISVIEAAIKAVEGIRKIFIELKIPQKLSEFNVKKIDLPEIARYAKKYSFLKNLPKDLPTNELETILIAAY